MARSRLKIKKISEFVLVIDTDSVNTVWFLVPTTLDEYCIKTQINNPTDDEDNFDWDPYDDEDDDEDMESDED